MSVGSDIQAMQYRPLGRTGLSVSLIGFGTSPLGDVPVFNCVWPSGRPENHG